jgi:hypothetical protein
MDNETLTIINSLRLEHATPFSITLLEDDCLSSLKQDRALAEYCWTLKPVFLAYLLENFNDIARITYLDADLFFYSDPNRIFVDADEHSVLLSSHDFSRQYKHLEKYCGAYNSGLISFINNSEGRECINWWKSRCFDLCSMQFRSNQFGDQKYLEEMAKNCKYVALFKAEGVNIAPWNHSKYVLRCNKDAVFINNKKLICYHFSGFRLLNNMEFSLSFGYERKPIPVLYKPYLQAVHQVLLDCQKLLHHNECYFIEDNFTKGAAVYKVSRYI